MKKIEKIITLAILVLSSLTITAQEKTPTTLFIGDKAPELYYGAWIKGTPIKEFKSGHLYIYEFWATWCGPCIASMPHLSEVARTKAKDVTIVAVDIWEDKTGKMTYDDIYAKVSKFTKGMGKNMDFNVITDTKDQLMAKNWMTAAGQAGLPTSMMVKDGVIQWMGHPVNLDSIITVVMDGKYDVTAMRKKAIDQANRTPTADEIAMTNATKLIDDAIKAKQYDRASQLTDSITATMPQNKGVVLNWNKFMMLLDHVGEKEAMDFVKKWQATNPGFRGSVGAAIVHKPNLSKESYLYAIDILRSMIDNPQPGSLMLNMIAIGYVNMGDYKSAAVAQEQAIAKAKEYLKEKKFVGFVMESTVTEYEAKLAEYKKLIK
ncbi:TlpA family protein disulfide reductase [Pedobacter sp. KBS0701]|uniref:TlpA disulfide reductase family protein n=1 Tax=Pedobacter sp. KBS0701 TaxID=2578106 RepID=UPI00110D354F|nr:TlpA disulfide reductase family protein [Pedobacter sp. KBS0701]QDW27908.1 TlpA family protein disulfide reductase [Pedobacter sp. KBS0701]